MMTLWFQDKKAGLDNKRELFVYVKRALRDLNSRDVRSVGCNSKEGLTRNFALFHLGFFLDGQVLGFFTLSLLFGKIGVSVNA